MNKLLLPMVFILLLGYCKAEPNSTISEPNNTHVVLEILDRPGFRAAMPEEQEISFEEYLVIKNRFIANHENWRPGLALTYRIPEGGTWRNYSLTLVSFDNKNIMLNGAVK